MRQVRIYECYIKYHRASQLPLIPKYTNLAYQRLAPPRVPFRPPPSRASTFSSAATISSSQLNYNVNKSVSQEPNPEILRRRSVRSASSLRDTEGAPPRLPPRPSHISSPWDIEEDDDEEPIYEKIDSNPAIYVDLIGAQPANTHILHQPATILPSKDTSRRSSTSSSHGLEIAIHRASHQKPVDGVSHIRRSLGSQLYLKAT